jgi:anti-sigma factor RsiW
MAEQTGKHFGSCKEIFAELSAYLDADLPPDACQEIDEHLSGCAPCVEFVNSLRRTMELCRGYEASSVPGPLTQEARGQLLAAFQQMLAAKKGSPPNCT